MTPATHQMLPLLLATLLLLAAVIVPRLRTRLPVWFRVLVRIVFFVLLTLLAQAILVSPLQPRFSATGSGRRFWEQSIEASWW